MTDAESLQTTTSRSIGRLLQESRQRFREQDLISQGLLEGDASEVFNAVRFCAREREAATYKGVRPAIFYGGGGAAGADGIGVAMAFQRLKFLTGFRVVAGISTGSHIATAHVTRQLERGCWSYRNVVTDPAFLNVARGIREAIWEPFSGLLDKNSRAKGFVDVEKPIRVYRGVERTVRGPFRTAFDSDFQTLVIPVTRYETGESILVWFDNVQPNYDLILDTIHASCALPWPIYLRKVTMPSSNSMTYRVVDGGMSEPVPIQSIVAALQRKEQAPTHIVVVLNLPQAPVIPTSSQRAVEWMISRRWPKKLRESFARCDDSLTHNLEFLRNSNIPYVIIHGSGKVGTFDNERRKIEDATLTKYFLTLNTLDRVLT